MNAQIGIIKKMVNAPKWMGNAKLITKRTAIAQVVGTIAGELLIRLMENVNLIKSLLRLLEEMLAQLIRSITAAPARLDMFSGMVSAIVSAIIADVGIIKLDVLAATKGGH